MQQRDHDGDDDHPDRPFWQAVLLTLIPTVFLALVEFVGGEISAWFKHKRKMIEGDDSDDDEDDEDEHDNSSSKKKSRDHGQKG